MGSLSITSDPRVTPIQLPLIWLFFQEFLKPTEEV